MPPSRKRPRARVDDVLASRPTREERAAAGRAERERVPLDAHAEVPDGTDRDAVALLRAQDEGRLASLVPIRWGRMSAQPFAFFRGAAAVMAHDLAQGPRTSLDTQLCGDAHLSNFGVFAAPDRRLVFDLNDFDETHPGPFEWDVKRLAASVVAAARNNQIDDKAATKVARAAVADYRSAIARLSALDPLDGWYHRVELDSLFDVAANDKTTAKLAAVSAKAARKDRLGALSKLTHVVDGQRRIKERPPLVVRLSATDREAELARVSRFFDDYFDSLPIGTRRLLGRYTLRDLSTKVVGVGSVGTRCLLALFDTGDGDGLFLQVKEAGPSVVAPYVAASAVGSDGRRVVEGQRLLQSAPDTFLGWSRFADASGERDYYVRQLWDGKASAVVEEMGVGMLTRYARLCGAVLARAHARSGDAASIAGYLGDDDTFDRAVARFATRYADLNATDHAVATQRIADGTIPAAADR